ncbi:hypothetical protein FHW88_000119 [Mucilaginibacter sp. SG538B]|nr:hypothetical protein [Mucilaginibacter sp. SG538B]
MLIALFISYLIRTGKVAALKNAFSQSGHWLKSL